MSLLSRIFPSLASPEEKIQKARSFLERQQFADARWEVEGLEQQEAVAIHTAALQGLADLNLGEARGLFALGNEGAAREHLEMARKFGASREDLRAIRREARVARADKANAEQAVREAEPPPSEGDDPLWNLPPDDPRLRYAMLVETYPQELRERLIELGSDFAAAVLKIETAPEDAFRDLGSFVGDEPLVRYERARAALAIGQLAAASSDLQAFGASIGHQRIGTLHTAVVLGQALSGLGRLDEALAVMEAELARDDDLELRSIRASLLEGLGRTEEAEVELADLLRKAPRNMGLHRAMARIQLTKGNRGGAMTVLEDGLTRCCSSPGKCGNQPLDVAAARMLARLYLEDRIEPKRSDDLLAQLGAHVRVPEWEDQYIAALVARNNGDPAVSRLTDELRRVLPPNDPRQAWVSALQDPNRSLESTEPAK